MDISRDGYSVFISITGIHPVMITWELIFRQNAQKCKHAITETHTQVNHANGIKGSLIVYWLACL